jgi:hypothetical protein
MKRRINLGLSPWEDVPTREAIQAQIGSRQLQPFRL